MKTLNKRNVLIGLGLTVLLAAPVAVYAATSEAPAPAPISPAYSSYYNVNASSYTANFTPAFAQGNSSQGSGDQDDNSCCTDGAGCGGGAQSNQEPQSL